MAHRGRGSLHKQAIEKCVPKKTRRCYASPGDLEQAIWQQLLVDHVVEKGFQAQYLTELQYIRENWTARYGFTFGPGSNTTAATIPVANPERQRQRQRVDLLDQDLPIHLAAYRTLADIPSAELRSAVAHVQSLMDRETVARCLQALWRYGGDPRGAIDWLGRTSQ